jgi:hypothetical protein
VAQHLRGEVGTAAVRIDDVAVLVLGDRVDREVAPQPGAVLRSVRASACSSRVAGSRKTGKSRPTAM